MKLISDQKLKATKENRLKNDCPLQCDKTHCDVCQFRDRSLNRSQIVDSTKVLPDMYGRELYY